MKEQEFERRLDEVSADRLSFIIAQYGNRTVYHDYNNKTNSLSAGKPFSLETAKELVEFIDRREVNFENIDFKGIIPRNVLSYKTNSKNIIWFSKPMKRKLFFKGVNIKTTEYPLPYLLWKLRAGSIYIYALKEEPVNENIPLFNSPFLNVYKDNTVCEGNAFGNVNDEAIEFYEDLIRETEHSFFNSYFTHTNSDKLIKGNLLKMYEDLERKEKFDNSVLLNTGLKIKDIL